MMLPRGIIDFAPWDRSWVNALYDAQIRRLDEEFFGRLRQVLRETGLVDNTLIVISADHGEELLEHGLVGHVSTYKEGRLVEELVRIPLIFAGPGIEPGQRIDERVQVIDAMPTILDLVGVPAAETMQGRSLLPLTRGQERPSLPLFFETSAGGYPASIEDYSRRTRAVIAGDWKLVTHVPSGETELFDLAMDPLEDEDEYDNRSALAGSLKTLLDDWILNSEPLIADGVAGISAPVVQGDSPTVIEFPVDGDTLRYLGTDQTVRLRWTGENTSYRVLYEVGEGVYHLKGEMSVDSNTPSYGPFHASFWNSVVLYSPFTVRVHPVGRPDLISAPVTFSLAPSDGSALAIAPGQILMSISVFGREVLTLAAGCVLGLVDLSIWLSENLSAADATAWALLLAIAGALAWPRLQPLGERRVKAWLWLLGYIGIVYATIPIFPKLWHGLRIHAGDSVRHLGTIVVVAFVVWAIWRLHRRVSFRSPVPYLLSVLLMAAYTVLLIRFGQFPAERLHLLEYGMMAVLVHRALTADRDSRLADHGLALGLTILIGFGDETIQWILPQRFFELKDVGLNAVSGILGLALARLVAGERM
ncbi:MAG: VanZ family protein [Gemmatimonadetes bacterium]|nr:VanZ family protein [Gemmatimonadota bacterium]